MSHEGDNGRPPLPALVITKPAMARPVRARKPRFSFVFRVFTTGLLVLAAVGCHVFTPTHPPALDRRGATLDLGDITAPVAVEIDIDDEGVPHIFSASEVGLAWGLGFMHARDRGFQLEIARHAGQGRLTELFGESALEVDQQLRLLTYRLREQERALSERDRGLLSAYADGINAGVEHTGPSAEMRLLRHEPRPMTVREVLSMVRLQAWFLSGDMRDELSRARILARLPPGDTRRELLLEPVPTNGVAIVSGKKLEQAFESAPDGGVAPADVDGGRAFDAGVDLSPPEEAALPAARSLDAGSPDAGEPAPPGAALFKNRAIASLSQTEPAEALAAALGLVHGASNAWVVAGEHTASGKPILCNDPHLRHSAPSSLYLAHLEHPAFTAAGATVPGIPVIVIGHTRHLAFGQTTAFADTQDLVAIETDARKRGVYKLDGAWERFGQTPHVFLDDDGDPLASAVLRTTAFGPVLPDAYGYRMEPGALYAVMWTGFEPAATSTAASGFFDLYRATDAGGVRAAIEKVGMPSQNIVFALDDGTIGYHLMGRVPRRKSGEPIDRPRDGRTRDAAWSGVLSVDEKPSLENPAPGFIVTANQRILESGPALFAIGQKGYTPHRAERIHTLLRALVDAGQSDPAQKPDADALLAIQQDVHSPEAERLARILGENCPEDILGFSKALARSFCQQVRDFDGAYTKESVGALAFVRLLESFTLEVLGAHLGRDVALQLKDDHATAMAIENAILDEANGKPSPLFDDRRTPAREGLRGFVGRAAEPAIARIVDDLGTAPATWRWGRVHTLTFKSQLAAVPVVGALFQTSARPTAGWRRTPRAENGLPVETGAVLRLVAELESPPEARMVLDLGNSGHFGHPDFDRMRARWERGAPLVIPVERAGIPVRTSLRIPAGADASTLAASAPDGGEVWRDAGAP